MPPRSFKPVEPRPALDVSAMPEFARAIRGLSHVPKAEVDAAIAKEEQAKNRKKKMRQP
jgi:hypothetical protein